MICYPCIDSRSGGISFALDLFVCIQYDNYILFGSPLIRNSNLWVENLTYLKISQILQPKKSGLPTTHRTLEKRKRFFCPPDLVLTWSLLAWLLAAPKPVSAASKPSSVPSVPEPTLPPNSAAAADARICPLSRKPNCWNPFFKKHAKAPPSWWPTSETPTKPLLARKSRLPQSIACWRVTDGGHSARIVSWTQIECNCREHFEPILPFWTARQTEFCLADTLSNPARYGSCRSDRCISGGDC